MHDMRRFALARGEIDEMIDQVIRNHTCANTALYPGETADFEVDDSPASPVSHWEGQGCALKLAPVPGVATPGSVAEMGDSDGDAGDDKNKDDINDEETTVQSSPPGSFDGSTLSQLLSAENLIVPSGQGLFVPSSQDLFVPNGQDLLDVDLLAAEADAHGKGPVGDRNSGNSSPGDVAVVRAVNAHLDIEPPPQGFVVANTLSGLRRLHYIGNCGKVP